MPELGSRNLGRVSHSPTTPLVMEAECEVDASACGEFVQMASRRARALEMSTPPSKAATASCCEMMCSSPLHPRGRFAVPDFLPGGRRCCSGELGEDSGASSSSASTAPTEKGNHNSKLLPTILGDAVPESDRAHLAVTSIESGQRSTAREVTGTAVMTLAMIKASSTIPGSCGATARSTSKMSLNFWALFCWPRFDFDAVARLATSIPISLAHDAKEVRFLTLSLFARFILSR